MKLSVTTDMFNYSFNPGLDEKLGLFKKHGFDYLHWCDNWNDDVLYSKDDMKAHARAIKDHDLVCLDVHGTATEEYSIDSPSDESHRMYVKLLENRVKFCHAVEGDAVVVHPPKHHDHSFEKRMLISRKAIEAVKELCLDVGVKLAIENCYDGTHFILSDYFILYEPEFVGFCYDSGHANLNGNLHRLMEFGDRLEVTHLHDNKGVDDDHQYLGWGTIDWEDVSMWLKGLEYRKPLNLEVAHDPRHFDGTMEEFMEKVVESTRLL